MLRGRIGVRITGAFCFMVLLVVWFGCQPVERTSQDEERTTKIVEMWNTGNLALIDECYSPDFIRHEVDISEDIVGTDAFKESVTRTRTIYPDFHVVIDEEIGGINKVIYRWTVTATNTGPGDFPPTGKKIKLSGASIVNIANGKVTEEWAYFNDAAVLQQLGYRTSPPLTETTFARVTLTQGNVDTMSETIQLYKDSVVPSAQSQNGYRGIYLLSDFKAGKSISISLWDSEEDAIANEQSGYYQEQVDKFKEFYTATPVREGYVVSVQEQRNMENHLFDMEKRKLDLSNTS